MVFLDVFAAGLDFFATALRLAAMSSSSVVLMMITRLLTEPDYFALHSGTVQQLVETVVQHVVDQLLPIRFEPPYSPSSLS